MANAIPMQLSFKNNTAVSVYDVDSKLSQKERSVLLKEALKDSFVEFLFDENQKVNTGYYVNRDNKKIFFMLANVTFMGGKDGQHPKDLKRIQYNFKWRDFYNKYNSKGKVLWLGIYSYKGANIWAIFEPESYLLRHSGKAMQTKDGKPSTYSCHIYLNDLYQGFLNEYFFKNDRNHNMVGAIRFDKLSYVFDNYLNKDIENPIIKTINEINIKNIKWNEWIQADEAIKYMRDVKKKTGYGQWKENMWNGFFVEAIYGEKLFKSPSDNIYYLASCKNKKITSEYKGSGLDLGLIDSKSKFIGDLKAISIGDDYTLLNDESRVNAALNKYKRIWFLMYIHDKKPGKTNNYEMVKWRNNYIKNAGEWRKNKKFDELSAPNTPHSVCFNEMVVIELNEITKHKYFSVGKQFGKNSDGRERNKKFKINKKLLKTIDDDCFVIYRYQPNK